MRFSFIIMSVLFLSCQSENGKQEKAAVVENQLHVDLHPNIHTSHIIEMFVWPGEYPTRPMCVAAQKYFEPFKEHPAIQLSDSLLQNELFYFDELTEILLYLEDFPSTRFKYSLEYSPYSERLGIINEWVQKLAQFYVDADVASFLKAHEEFYKGAIHEVANNLPPKDFVKQMEAYYREHKLKYTLIPAPEMPTGGAYGQRGIGPYVYTPDGMLIYQVISASLPVAKDSLTDTYKDFGFDNPEFILRNSYHEFGHAFVNPILAKKEHEALLNQYSYLFTPALQKVMEAQNYDNWFDCIAEHLVRLGEIRLAERSGHEKWAHELRKHHTEKLNFIFLPELETKIKEYEQDESYFGFEAFLPNLLKVLGHFDAASIANRIHKNNDQDL